MTSRPIGVVVLASGRGSNLGALLDAVRGDRCLARIAAVVSDKPVAPALDLARQAGIATRVIEPRQFTDRAGWDSALAETVAAFSPVLVVLAGFMRIVGPAMLERFPSRIINVHPALLPAFPGKDAPAQAIAARVRVSGCTVHIVDAGVDTGPILAQAAVPVLPLDDAARLHERIQVVEHILLPAVVDRVARGELLLGGDPVWAKYTVAEGAALFVPALG